VIDLHPRLLEISRTVQGPLLAFDTSTARAALCTVAWQGGRVDDLDFDAASVPSESLVEVLAAAMAEFHLEVSTLKAIVIGIGPGSYTGLRVGLATAKGLAFGGNVPLYGVSSLAMLAASCGPGSIAPVLGSRVNEVFAAAYNVGVDGLVESTISDGAYIPADFVAQLAKLPGEQAKLVGSGATVCFGAGAAPGTAVEMEPRLFAGYGILHAADRIIAGKADDPSLLAPLYLRVSELNPV